MTAFAALTAAPTRVFLKLMTEARARYWARLSGTLPSSQSHAHATENSILCSLQGLLSPCSDTYSNLLLTPLGSLIFLFTYKTRHGRVKGRGLMNNNPPLPQIYR